jgi:hypothetical protein
VVVVIIATMLLFKFEGYEKLRRMDVAIAWIPLILMDFVIVEFLIAVVSWYPTKYAAWCAVLMSVQLAALLVGSIVIAVWMWNSISIKSGLGGEEKRVVECDEDLPGSRTDVARACLFFGNSPFRGLCAALGSIKRVKKGERARY